MGGPYIDPAFTAALETVHVMPALCATSAFTKRAPSVHPIGVLRMTAREFGLGANTSGDGNRYGAARLRSRNYCTVTRPF